MKFTATTAAGERVGATMSDQNEAVLMGAGGARPSSASIIRRSMERGGEAARCNSPVVWWTTVEGARAKNLLAASVTEGQGSTAVTAGRDAAKTLERVPPPSPISVARGGATGSAAVEKGCWER